MKPLGGLSATSKERGHAGSEYQSSEEFGGKMLGGQRLLKGKGRCAMGERQEITEERPPGWIRRSPGKKGGGGGKRELGRSLGKMKRGDSKGLSTDQRGRPIKGPRVAGETLAP